MTEISPGAVRPKNAPIDVNRRRPGVEASRAIERKLGGNEIRTASADMINDLKAVTGTWPEYWEAVFKSFRQEKGRIGAVASDAGVFFTRNQQRYWVREGSLAGRENDFFDLAIVNQKFEGLSPEDEVRLAKYDIPPIAKREAIENDEEGFFSTRVGVHHVADEAESSDISFRNREIYEEHKPSDSDTVKRRPEHNTRRVLQGARQFIDALLSENPQAPITIEGEYKELPTS